jgi:aminoglycoside 3-N-acetyltransferase
MTYNTTITQLTDDLLQLGVVPGGALMVHASLKSLGEVEGGAETVIRALLNAVGAEGTLLMPALSYATVDEDNPCFDQQKTPSCVGALPEYFRLRRGTLRSIHPTHSVSAYGKNAESLLKDHQLDSTPCGVHSPFYRLREAGGQILMLGCGMQSNTSMHAIEEVAKVPYLLKNAVEYNIIHADGSTGIMAVRRHNFTGHYLQFYDRLEPLLPDKALKTGMVLKAHCHLMDCRLMWETALNKMNESTLYFVEPVGDTIEAISKVSTANF